MRRFCRARLSKRLKAPQKLTLVNGINFDPNINILTVLKYAQSAHLNDSNSPRDIKEMISEDEKTTLRRRDGRNIFYLFEDDVDAIK